jgi:hypothetical protein
MYSGSRATHNAIRASVAKTTIEAAGKRQLFRIGSLTQPAEAVPQIAWVSFKGGHNLKNERPIAITTTSNLMAIAGPVSRRMLERYSHVRMEAKRSAMDRWPRAPKRRVMTQTMTQTLGVQAFAPFKVLGNLVDLVGIEPTTSSMPWNSQNRIALTAKALKVGRVGKNR